PPAPGCPVLRSGEYSRRASAGRRPWRGWGGHRMGKRTGTLLVATVAGLALVSAADAAKAPAAKATTAAGKTCTDARTGKTMDCVPATYDTFDIPFAKL